MWGGVHSVMKVETEQSLFLKISQKFVANIKKSICGGHVVKHRVSTCSIKHIQLRFISQSITQEVVELCAKCPFRWATALQLPASWPSCCRWLCAPSSSSAAAPPAAAASSAGTPSRCRRSPCTGARSGCRPSRRLSCERRAGGEGRRWNHSWFRSTGDTKHLDQSL